MSDDPSDDGPGLPPDQAILEESEHVVGLSDNRYLVSPSIIDESTIQSVNQVDEAEDDEPSAVPSNATHPPSLDLARATIHHSLRKAKGEYTIELNAVIEGTLYNERIETNDVVEAFERLNRRFASGVGDDLPVSEVLDILLTKSSLADKRRSHSLGDVLEAYGLGPQNTIEDLIELVNED